MNARVFLLVLVTGLFMAIWNGDQNAMQAAVARREQARAMRIALAETGVRSDSGAMTSVAADIPKTSGDVPLPVGIPAGQYQAVSQTGLIRLIDVPTLVESESKAVREFYISDDSSGVRWYLVRIQPIQTHVK